MKKSKVDAVVRKHAAAARAAGEAAGRATERDRWTALLPVPGNRDVTWLFEPPKALHHTVVVMPGFPQLISERIDYRMAREHKRIEFEAIPMALSLASGQQIRWFHWRAHGPYPVAELAVLR